VVPGGGREDVDAGRAVSGHPIRRVSLHGSPAMPRRTGPRAAQAGALPATVQQAGRKSDLR
jgi:hypothetical protein